MSGRLARALTRPRSIRTAWLIPLGLCLAGVILGTRRDHDPENLLGLILAGGLVILGAQDFVQSRRPPRPIVEGDLVHLRPMRPRDAPAFAATIDADVIAENRWDPTIRDNYIRAVERSVLPTTWAICQRQTSEIVGVISVTQVGDLEMELGTWMGRHFRGKGYTSDAVVALMRGLEGSRCPTIEASTSVTNVPMQSALRRAGFTEKHRYTHQFPNGEAVAAIRFTRSVDSTVS